MTNDEIAKGLRRLADLYFARYETSLDRGFQTRGFAFARAAESVAASKAPVLHAIRGGVAPRYCGGASVQEAILDIASTGCSRREAGLQRKYNLPDGLAVLEELPGLTRPFLFVLWSKFGAKDRDGLIDALPRIKQDSEAVYLRLYSALLADAQANMRLNGIVSGRLPTDHPNEANKPKGDK